MSLEKGMFTTQYWTGQEWVNCSAFYNESLNWIALGRDNINYRTVDDQENPINDKSTDKARQEQISVAYLMCVTENKSMTYTIEFMQKYANTSKIMVLEHIESLPHENN